MLFSLLSEKFAFFLKHWGQKPHPLCSLPDSSRQMQSLLPVGLHRFWFDIWGSYHQRQNPPQYFFPGSELLVLVCNLGLLWDPHTCIALANDWFYFDLKDFLRDTSPGLNCEFCKGASWAKGMGIVFTEEVEASALYWLERCLKHGHVL